MTRFMIGDTLARTATGKDAQPDVSGGASGSGSSGARFARRLKVLEVVGMDEKKEYIERGALIAELQEELDFYPLLHTKEFNDGFNAGLKRALRLAKSQPTADVVEVRHGEWIEHDDDWCGAYYTCSACGCDWTTIDGTPQENNMKYCPECGAKMDGERKDIP